MNDTLMQLTKFLLPGLAVVGEQVQALTGEVVNYVVISALFGLLKGLTPGLVIFTLYRVLLFAVGQMEATEVEYEQGKMHCWQDAEGKLTDVKRSLAREEGVRRVRKEWQMWRGAWFCVATALTLCFCVIPSVWRLQTIVCAVYTPRIAAAKMLLEMKDEAERVKR